MGGYFKRAFLFVLGPIAAAIVHTGCSPNREYDADRFAADLCDSPHGLADALLRLEQATELVSFQASPATEPLYTTNPFADEGLARLFVTHPPLGERVRRLRALDPGVAREAARGLKPRSKRAPRGARKNGRRPTLPGDCSPSTIGASGLNFSVRNGKRCFPAAMTAQLVRYVGAESVLRRLRTCAHPQNSIAVRREF